MFHERNARAGRVAPKEEESWRAPSFTRRNSQSQTVRQSSTSSDRKETSSTLLDEVEQILSTDLEPSTVRCYESAVNQYKDFVRLSKDNELDPQENGPGMDCLSIPFHRSEIISEICTGSKILFGVFS